MKKIALKVSIVFVLISSLVAGMQVVKVTQANPTWGVYPTEPNQDKPILIIENPQNDSICTQNGIILNFTVIKPSSWNQIVAPFGSPAVGRIESVNVSLNGKQEYQDFLNTNYLNGADNWNKNYSICISGLLLGTNIIEVTVFAKTSYFNENSTNNMVSFYPMNVTDTLYLNYSEASPTPTLSLIELPYGGLNPNPTPNSTNVPLNTTISLYFTRPPSICDLNITPNVPIKERIFENDGFSGTYVFYLAEQLQPQTTYTVTITYGQETAPEGFKPTTNRTWLFTTEITPILSPSPTPDNIQAEDATPTIIILALVIAIVAVAAVFLRKRK